MGREKYLGAIWLDLVRFGEIEARGGGAEAWERGGFMAGWLSVFCILGPVALATVASTMYVRSKPVRRGTSRRKQVSVNDNVLFF